MTPAKLEEQWRERNREREAKGLKQLTWKQFLARTRMFERSVRKNS